MGILSHFEFLCDTTARLCDRDPVLQQSTTVLQYYFSDNTVQPPFTHQFIDFDMVILLPEAQHNFLYNRGAISQIPGSASGGASHRTRTDMSSSPESCQKFTRMIILTFSYIT